MDINAKIPNVDMNINKPNIDLDAKLSNINMDINEPNMDINAKISDLKINKPKLDANNNLSGEIGGNMKILIHLELFFLLEI